MDDDEARRRLGEIVRRERQERYGDKKAAYVAAKLNPQTWDRVEDGEPVREDSLVRVFKALGWTVSQGWGVLGGDEPPSTLRVDSTFHAHASGQVTSDPVRKAIQNAPLLDERGRTYVLDAYDREVQREAEIRGQVGT